MVVTSLPVTPAIGYAIVVNVVRTVAALRAEVGASRTGGASIGLVPTMGALHEGHLSLIRRAAACTDLVVVSIFVNPTQFNDPSDLAAYPRDESRDVELARQAGANVVFCPPPAEVYPEGFCTCVRIDGPITETLEGAVRGPAHFWGVATVVAKLFGMVQPDVAFFGQKDAQQCVVVRRLVEDLDLPIEIEICPTVREPDGLAMSSRNVRLNHDERARAVALVEGLRTVAEAIAAGERDPREAAGAGIASMTERGVVPEYLALVHPDTFEQPAVIDRRLIAAVAAPVGPVRLIDNLFVEPV